MPRVGHPLPFYPHVDDSRIPARLFQLSRLPVVAFHLLLAIHATTSKICGSITGLSLGLTIPYNARCGIGQKFLA